MNFTFKETINPILGVRFFFCVRICNFFLLLHDTLKNISISGHTWFVLKVITLNLSKKGNVLMLGKTIRHKFKNILGKFSRQN